MRSISADSLQQNGSAENGVEEGKEEQVGEGPLAGEGSIIDTGKGKFGMKLQFVSKSSE